MLILQYYFKTSDIKIENDMILINKEYNENYKIYRFEDIKIIYVYNIDRMIFRISDKETIIDTKYKKISDKNYNFFEYLNIKNKYIRYTYNINNYFIINGFFYNIKNSKKIISKYSLDYNILKRKNSDFYYDFDIKIYYNNNSYSKIIMSNISFEEKINYKYIYFKYFIFDKFIYIKSDYLGNKNNIHKFNNRNYYYLFFHKLFFLFN